MNNKELKNIELDIKYMKEALKEAEKAYIKEEIPIGCIIVDGDKIIGRSYNKKESETDPTAHAEINAIKEACMNKKSWRLNSSTMYTTLEPCFMCMGAIMEARIGRLVYATKDMKRGSAQSVVDMSKLNIYHKIQIDSGVCEDEARTILQNFFKILRKKGK